MLLVHLRPSSSGAIHCTYLFSTVNSQKKSWWQLCHGLKIWIKKDFFPSIMCIINQRDTHDLTCLGGQWGKGFLGPGGCKCNPVTEWLSTSMHYRQFKQYFSVAPLKPVRFLYSEQRVQGKIFEMVFCGIYCCLQWIWGTSRYFNKLALSGNIMLPNFHSFWAFPNFFLTFISRI